ncbi:hypothetical protein BVRB_2g030460 [Beta vulgaris subsp. vulgaris]|nr:hypothetical protein BVRB_2g030460 [Beta vulgaris subsp. vulgaris]
MGFLVSVVEISFSPMGVARLKLESRTYDSARVC